MKTLENKQNLELEIKTLKKAGRSIGFVPTMGALHSGHLSLIESAKSQCDVVVCSIFINPTQFNDAKDFDRYPRNYNDDAELLKSVNCDILFLPSVKEIYPDESFKLNIDFGFLETVLEGKYRPGHFKGVGMVVKRLFELVNPDHAFFGLKDYQQFMVIKKLVEIYQFPIQLHGMPTIREKDGLAMSSRNKLLNTEEYKEALVLSKMLRQSIENYSNKSIEELKAEVIAEIANHPLMKLEYFEFADAENLQIMNEKNDSKNPIALIAAFVGKIRLIDNMRM